MKAGWQIKRLGDLSDLITKGTTPTSIGHAFVSEGINFIKVESISENGQFVESKFAHITQDCHDALKRSQLKDGDILFSIAGALGRTALVIETILSANINQALAIIRLKKSNDVLPEFVLKTLETGFLLEQIEKFKGGVAQQNLSLAQVQEFQIPLPPLPEQQRIVGILDEAFDGIATAKANTEKNLQNARALFESHLQSVFTQRGEGWVEKSLGDVCEYENGKAHEQCINEEGRFIVINSKFISTEGRVFKRSNKALLPLYPGDIAMVLSDVPNGKALAKCFLVEEADTYTLNQRICMIRSKKFHTKFLYYQLNRNRHFLSFDNGENQTNMRLNQVLSCPLFLPQISEQETIAAKLDTLREETHHLESIYQRKIAALDELKKSLLHQAFSGEL